MGLAGNFCQLVTVLGVLAGADSTALRNTLPSIRMTQRSCAKSSAHRRRAVLGFYLLAAVFLLAAAPISRGAVWTHAL